jgi:hypothetical protein
MGAFDGSGRDIRSHGTRLAGAASDAINAIAPGFMLTDDFNKLVEVLK